MTLPAHESLTLPGGTVVTFEPMRPSDGYRLTRFHRTLSADTTYLRFFSFHPELSEPELYRFTHVDHVDREAVVAVVDGEIVGVARFDRLGSGTDAEVAFVVADHWQGRGLGTALFHVLARQARAGGVERFVAETLPHNRRMLAVFHHCGLPVAEAFDSGIVRLTIDLQAHSASEGGRKGPSAPASRPERPVRDIGAMAESDDWTVNREGAHP